MLGKREGAMKGTLGEKCEADVKSALKSEGQFFYKRIINGQQLFLSPYFKR